MKLFHVFIDGHLYAEDIDGAIAKLRDIFALRYEDLMEEDFADPVRMERAAMQGNDFVEPTEIHIEPVGADADHR